MAVVPLDKQISALQPALDPLFPGIPNAEWIQECELNGEKVCSPKRERLLTMPCEWGTDQGLPATLVSVPLSAFAMAGVKTAQLPWAWQKHLDNERAQNEIQKIPIKLMSKTFFFFFYHEGNQDDCSKLKSLPYLETNLSGQCLGQVALVDPA